MWPPATLASLPSIFFFRFASYRHPEHAETIQQVLAIPRKKTEHIPRCFLTGAEMDALGTCLTCPRGAGTATMCCSSWRCVPVFGSPSSPGCAAATFTRPRCPRQVPGQGPQAPDTPLDKQTVELLRTWLNERRGEPDDALFPSRAAGGSAPTPCNASSPNTSRPHEPPVPASRTSRSAPTTSVTAAPWTFFETASTSQCWPCGSDTKTRVRQRLHPRRPDLERTGTRPSDAAEPRRQAGTLQANRSATRIPRRPLKMPRSVTSPPGDHRCQQAIASTPTAHAALLEARH